MGDLISTSFYFLIGFTPYIQDYTATTRYGVTRKKQKDIENNRSLEQCLKIKLRDAC